MASWQRRAILVVAVSGLASPEVLHGQPWSFARIADTTTLVPNSAVPFLVFELPSIRDGTVAFAGFGGTMTGPAGVYTGSGAGLSIMADRNTPIPNGTGNFTGFALGEGLVPSLSGGATAFVGDGFGTSFIQRGIYLHEGGSLTRVVDRATPIPNGGGATFAGIRGPSLENGRVVFVGGPSFVGLQRGAYSWANGSLSVIADTSTPIPGWSGTFASVNEANLDGGRVLIQGTGASGYQGLFLADNAGAITRLYDTNTPIPSGTGTFTGLSQSVLSDGRVVFRGLGLGQEGLYTDVSGALTLLANHDTTAPGFPSQTFSGFGRMAIDGSIVAFSAIVGGGPTGVWSTHSGALAKVLAEGDALDGRIVAECGMGGQGLDGNSLAIGVSFTDGTRGIYMATIPAPAGALILALLPTLAARRRWP